MSVIETFVGGFKFYRQRTLGLLEKIEKLPDPAAALAWRPGPQRAHIGWQLTHIAVTEDIFASERLCPEKKGEFTSIWPRFRGGSKPDENLPTAAEIRRMLSASRESLLATLAGYDDTRLGEIPASLADRGLTIHDVLCVIGWHEAHHQGQAHITLNLFQARS